MDNKWIEEAVEKFRNLLVGQTERAERLSQIEKFDLTEKKAVNPIVIGICDGDGIGSIIMREARRVLAKLLKQEIDSGKVIIKEVKSLLK